MREYVYEKEISEYGRYLVCEEKSDATVEKYLRDVKALCRFISGAELTKELVIAYKSEIQSQYKPASVNSMLASINGFLAFIGRGDCKVKQIKMQRSIYRPEEKELTKAEYRRLVTAAAQKSNERIMLIMETICATGIRISELAFITVAAVKNGEAYVRLKGKTRTVFIPPALKKLLMQYIKKHSITGGTVFVTKSGKPMNRSNIWREMKALCKSANVDHNKVFPHNLRHLFARTYYDMEKDIAKLADILGHSSIETTRIYIISTGIEHRRQISALGLVV